MYQKGKQRVIVGNIGTVYEGNNAGEAGRTYSSYVDQSKNNKGRATGEDVTWMVDDEIHSEHAGTLHQDDKVLHGERFDGMS